MAHEQLEPLGRGDRLHLRAPQGWLQLGNDLEADTELDEIAPQLRAYPDVLEVRGHVYARAKKREDCVDIAGAIIQLDLNRPDAWIHHSFALRELKRTQEAFDQLLSVAGRFPNVWTIPYHLACYTCQLGRIARRRTGSKRR